MHYPPIRRFNSQLKGHRSFQAAQTRSETTQNGLFPWLSAAALQETYSLPLQQ
jgi:hypothetical protein